MVGMQNMSAAVAPLRSEPAFIDMLTKFSNPFIGILIGLLVTAVFRVHLLQLVFFRLYQLQELFHFQ